MCEVSNISQCKRLMLQKTKFKKVVVKGGLTYYLETERERPVYKIGYGYEDINKSFWCTNKYCKASRCYSTA